MLFKFLVFVRRMFCFFGKVGTIPFPGGPPRPLSNSQRRSLSLSVSLCLSLCVSLCCKTHRNTGTCNCSYALGPTVIGGAVTSIKMRQRTERATCQTTPPLLPWPDPLVRAAWNVYAQLCLATLASGHFSQSSEMPTPASGARTSSNDFGLVSVFAGSQNSLTSMCRCFPNPWRHSIDFAAAESTVMSMGTSAFKPNASAAPRASALYAASPLQVGTVA